MLIWMPFNMHHLYHSMAHAISHLPFNDLIRYEYGYRDADIICGTTSNRLILYDHLCHASGVPSGDTGL
jgi:hypothetical protein